MQQEDPVVALFRAEPDLQGEVVQEHASRCLRLLREGASLRRLLGRRSTASLPRYDLPAPRTVGQAIAQGQLVAEQERRRLDLGKGARAQRAGDVGASDPSGRPPCPCRAKSPVSF